ncbi:MAG: hypothetical protein D6767_04505 [Candidatus Hydrogenedentota bacterium]|nr:MAG: hypothetical protein D6767_04505 [Candidatus Hydrogenedentota bacterium]
MSNFSAPISLLKDEGLTLCYGEPLVFHCNHYNLFLQRTIEDTGEYIDAETILVDGAVSCTYSMLNRLFEKNPKYRDPKIRLEIASAIYSQLGFGLLPIHELTEDGGVVHTKITHYSYGWLKKWGKRDKPVDYFTRGYLIAALAQAYFLPPGAFSCKQTKCLSMGDEQNEFVLERTSIIKPYPLSPGKGVTINTADFSKRIDTNVNEEEITEAVRGMPLIGNEDGLIPAFGVFLTRHFANYYNYISYEMANQVTEKTGEPELARDLLVEAGHVCGFNTFGGIMKSDEWYGLVEPQCKTREDWASGIVAVINALGWGYWSILELEPGKKMLMQVDGSYESNGYLAVYGQAKNANSYLATGVTSALMNLLYHGDITEKPELTEKFYEKLFQSEDSFVAYQIASRAMGEKTDEITAKRLHEA